jgi:hypothetical protein
MAGNQSHVASTVQGRVRRLRDELPGPHTLNESFRVRR